MMLDAHLPTVVDPDLAVREVASEFTTPISMAFLGTDEFLLLEKNTGQVKHVTGDAPPRTVLDLDVNFASERGLLGIALHPQFPQDPGVYLYWTESTTGADTRVTSQTSLLGNRVDRFVWDGTSLSHDEQIIRLRAIQQDAGQPQRGNHDGGVLRFGPDGKLYIYIGDVGRRGQMQNLPDGPGPAGNQPDDQFGGPEPDDAHLTGVILRLNDDGSTPTDNPFYQAGILKGTDTQAGRNLQKVFAYGVRNGFGMAFDPISGELWEAQNGDDSFTELNRVEPGANLGWIQVMGPIDRIEQFKSIETDDTTIDPVTRRSYFGLQQNRWSPENIADSAEEALQRLFMVYESGNKFAANLTGGEEVPAVTTEAAAEANFELDDDGQLHYRLVAKADVQDATQAHIHLGARGQNGPVAVFLFRSGAGPQSFRSGDLIAEGTLDDGDLIARPGFTPTIAELAQRMREGRAYVNLHTTAHPGGEVRGQVTVSDVKPVSHYSDPEFSWKFEVAPAAVGFLDSRALGPQYRGDMFVGAARAFLDGGQLFHFNLTGNRRKIAVDDPRLEDRVADNEHKFDITESESLLFGREFGIATDIHTGPNGNLFVVSLTRGAVYEIFRSEPGKSPKAQKDLASLAMLSAPPDFSPPTAVASQAASIAPSSEVVIATADPLWTAAVETPDAGSRPTNDAVRSHASRDRALLDVLDDAPWLNDDLLDNLMLAARSGR